MLPRGQPDFGTQLSCPHSVRAGACIGPASSCKVTIQDKAFHPTFPASTASAASAASITSAAATVPRPLLRLRPLRASKETVSVMELLRHQEEAALLQLDADEKAIADELNALRGLPSKALRERAVRLITARQLKRSDVKQEKAQQLLMLEQARDDHLSWSKQSGHNANASRDEPNVVARATIEGQAVAKLAVINAHRSINVQLCRVEEAAAVKSAPELRKDLVLMGLEPVAEDHDGLLALLLSATQSRLKAEEERERVDKRGKEEEMKLMTKDAQDTRNARNAREKADEEAAQDAAAQLKGVNELIERLEVTKTPSPFGIALTSVSSPTHERGTKPSSETPPRRGRQSSFERRQRLRMPRPPASPRVFAGERPPSRVAFRQAPNCVTRAERLSELMPTSYPPRGLTADAERKATKVTERLQRARKAQEVAVKNSLKPSSSFDHLKPLVNQSFSERLRPRRLLDVTI